MNERIDLRDTGFTDEELFTRVDNDALAAEKITAPRYSYWHSVFRVFFKNKLNIIILAILVAMVLFAYIYPHFANYDKYSNVLAEGLKHLSPSEAMAAHPDDNPIHWVLGSGGVGESTFDAIWTGSRISMSLAFICALINMTIGILVGAIWGFSKKFGMFMQEVYNILGNIPYILLISVVVMILSASFWSMVFALTITGWLAIAYFIRTQVIIIRDREYNLASRCLGTSIFKIAIKNIMPFMISIIVTLAATEIPSYISYEVFLSYIGLTMSDISLGRLIGTAQPSMFTPGMQIEFWAPVAVTAVITIVLYVVGQNLGDAADPRTHM